MEVCWNWVWGTVCDDYWSPFDARVACRQLGFPTTGDQFLLVTFVCNMHMGCQNSPLVISLFATMYSLCLSCAIFVGAQALHRAHFGQGTGSIHLDNLFCNSSESRLIDCRHNGISVHNCAHSEDAGLRCQGMYIHMSCNCT